MAKPLVWYIGAITSTTCGRATGPHDAANGMPTISSKTPGLSIRMTLGEPVEPLLQMPLVCGDTTDGRGVASSSAVAWSQGRSSAPTETPSMTSSTRSRSQSGRSQRTGTGMAPSFHAASTVITNSGELRSPTATAGAGAGAPSVEGTRDLGRAAVQLGPGDDRLAAVDRGHEQHG